MRHLELKGYHLFVAALWIGYVLFDSGRAWEKGDLGWWLVIITFDTLFMLLVLLVSWVFNTFAIRRRGR